MRRKLLMPGCFWAVAVLLLSDIAPVQAGRGTEAADGRLVTVLNPAVTEKLAPRVPLAPRLDGLEGKTIYLVDMNYEGLGGTPVMAEMREWFAANMPRVHAVYKLKRGNYVEDDPALWKEIASGKGNGVVLGVAG
jgi:hypothetical protein